MADIIRLTTPLSQDDVLKLRIGDSVLLSGIIYTGRDAAHKRLVELLKEGRELPVDIKGHIIYYVGPSPAKPGQAIGSAGPTTSYRMDPYSPILMKMGMKGMIGKGPRGEEVRRAMQEYKAVYFAATGGAAALIANSIKKAEVVLYEDLGAEAVRKLTVEDFPCIVANDTYGGDIYQEGINRYSLK